MLTLNRLQVHTFNLTEHTLHSYIVFKCDCGFVCAAVLLFCLNMGLAVCVAVYVSCSSKQLFPVGSVRKVQ